MDLHGVYGPV